MDGLMCTCIRRRMRKCCACIRRRMRKVTQICALQKYFFFFHKILICKDSGAICNVYSTRIFAYKDFMKPSIFFGAI